MNFQFLFRAHPGADAGTRSGFLTSRHLVAAGRDHWYYSVAVWKAVFSTISLVGKSGIISVIVALVEPGSSVVWLLAMFVGCLSSKPGRLLGYGHCKRLAVTEEDDVVMSLLKSLSRWRTVPGLTVMGVARGLGLCEQGYWLLQNKSHEVLLSV